MAEFVEFRSEEMIPELEQMERIRLFDKGDIRLIAKRRKEFEYKIQRRTKCKEDYLRYIQYEMDLLKLIRVKREKLGLIQKKAEIDYSIANRVNKLFKQAVFRFQDDVRIWLAYYRFCKQVRFYSTVSRMLVRMLQVHSDKPLLWKLAAQWEFEDCHSVENARQFLLRGLRFHPDSKVLYTEAFRLELQYAALKRKQREEKEAAEAAAQAAATAADSSGTPAQTSESSSVSLAPATQSRSGDEITDQVIEGRLAEVIYETASKKVSDVAFLISLLSIAKDYSFTEKLQAKIVNDLLSRFPDDELTWDAMARRELEGLSYSADPPVSDALSPNNEASMEIVEEGASNNKPAIKNPLKERIRRCCAVYTAAVKQLPTERMWTLYLDTLFELNQDLSHLPTFKKKLLRAAFQGAHSAGLMIEKYYLHWVDILEKSKKYKKLGAVLRVATERIPSSVELWQVRLRFHLSKNEERAGIDVFQAAIARLGSENAATLPLWKMLLLYCQTKSSHKVEQVFRDGLQQGPAVSAPLKPMFLEWLVIMKGIVAARKVYETLSIQPPYCLELHNKMAALECMQPDINVKQIRKCYEVACEQFGKNNTDVWMEYVKFEQKRGDPKNVSEIYWRALKNLDPMHTDIFVSEFSLVKTGLTAPQGATT
ncbi:U3 small nucleolar RNA-associated protein 6 homolog [Anabrus simplex]|uniref:U3 small nucleolar RNA-associated protein 6 homolog n=1 Tax=Anabrus simplex TaxID=316456 RepID=UPI0034DDBD63